VKIKYHLIVIAAICLIVYACRKVSFNHPQNESDRYAAVKEWLHVNGGDYKSESVRVSTSAGIVDLKLDWDKAKTIRWRGVDFLDVPYVTKSGAVSLPADGQVGVSSFDLVVRRYSNGEHRAAIRTTTHITDANGDRNVQDYKMLDGRQMNVWYHDFHNGATVEATPLSLTDAQYRSLANAAAKAPRTLMSVNQSSAGVKTLSSTTIVDVFEDENGCIITRVREYEKGTGQLDDSTGYAGTVIVGSYLVSDKTYKICPSGENGPSSGDNTGNGNSSPNGPSSPVGGGKDSSGYPDCSNEAPPPPPPPVKPGEPTAPYNPPTPCEYFPPEEPKPVPDDDPCTQISDVNTRGANTIIKDQNQELKDNYLGNSPNEYGYNQKLFDWHNPFNYMNTTVQTSGNPTHVDLPATFTWDATNGYTIGMTHDHPASGSAPSPDDIFALLYNYNKLSTIPE